ncbi:MAG: response regulator, partial [Actinomycetota bacterium]
MDKKLLLIVEDDPDVRKGLALRLRAHGFGIALAEDSITALNIARAKQPDLMILDIGLPGGDGLLMLERMQNLTEL